MNNQFDELTKNMAQSVARRGALKKFGIGLAGIVLASLGFANKAEAAQRFNCDCSDAWFGCRVYSGSPGKFKSCLRACAGCIGP